MDDEAKHREETEHQRARIRAFENGRFLVFRPETPPEEIVEQIKELHDE